MSMRIFERFITIVSGGAIWILAAGALFLLVFIYQQYGWNGLSEAIRVDIAKSATKFLVIIAIFIVIMGAVSFLGRKNPDKVHRIVSGQEGQIKMILISMSMPGPAGAKELRNEWENGANRAQVILCLTAMMAAGITMFIFRSNFLGAPLTLIWMGIAAGLMAVVWAIGRFFA